MKYCSNCGTQIISESKFCSGCGTQIAELQTKQTVSIDPTSENKLETTTNRILMPLGGIYEGELKDGIANGFGKLIYPEPDGDPDYGPFLKGEIYEGNFLNGKKHGFGKLYFEKNDDNRNFVYEGDWKFNEKSGSGKLTEKFGNFFREYIGEFNNDTITGEGTLRQLAETNSFNFEGSFLCDELKYGLLIGSYSYLGYPKYSVRYKGSFSYIPEVRIKLLDMFPAFDGELIFTWLETGESSKHIVKLGECESYDLMRDNYLENDDEEDDDEEDDDEDNYNDSPIKPKDGAGLR